MVPERSGSDSEPAAGKPTVLATPTAWLIAALAVAWVAVAGRNVNPFWYQGDSPRHAANGAFYLDLPRLLAKRFDVVEAAKAYYACRPAIAPTFWPPVFPLTEAAAFAMFGVSPQVARGVVLAWCLVAALVIFAILRSRLPLIAAAGSCLAFAASPGVILYGNSVMLEIPGLAMCLASAAVMEAISRRRAPVALLCLFPLEALAVLTQPKVLFLLPFTLALWGRTREVALLKSRALWGGCLLGSLLLLPWVYVTVVHAPIMIDEGLRLGPYRVTDIENWTYYLRVLPQLVGRPLMVLGTLGIVTSALTHNLMPRQVAAGLHAWGATVYVVASLLSLKADRFFVGIIPYFATFAACFVCWLVDRTAARWKTRRALLTTVLLLSVCAASSAELRPPPAPELDAFRETIRFLARQVPQDRPTGVLYDGRYDGNFVFMVRSEAPDVPLVVFRGAKHLYATKVNYAWGMETLASTADEIRAVIDALSCRYVVVEKTPSPDVGPSRRLRELLQDPEQFQQLFVAETRGPTGDLIVYRNSHFDQARSLPEQVAFSFPAAGRDTKATLRVDWRAVWPKAAGE